MSTEENISLPSFTVTASDGETTKSYQLADLKGGIIIYFYPKDSTPGCTTQANDFTENLSAFQKLGYTLLGVSRDSISSHEKFIAKQQIGFELISDPEETLCKHFDVIREKNMYGKKTLGIHRSTFVFNADGKLTHALRNVRAKGHVERLLTLLGS